jgi:hypothetical protein
MPIMANRKIYVRAPDEARNALKRLVTELAERIPGDLVNQERLVCASWVWMRTMDYAELARTLAPYIAAMRDRLAHEDPEAESGRVQPFGAKEVPLGPPPNRKRRQNRGRSEVEANG